MTDSSASLFFDLLDGGVWTFELYELYCPGNGWHLKVNTLN